MAARTNVHLQDCHVTPTRKHETAVYCICNSKATLSSPRLAASHVREGDVEGGGGRLDLVPAPRGKLVDACSIVLCRERACRGLGGGASHISS